MVTLKRTYLTTLAREIKQSFGRFAAVFGIFALGVGFLAGLLATAPDMHKSLDKYFDEAGMADVFIKGTMGLTADDVEAVAALESVDKVMPAYVTDVLMDMDDEVLVTRLRASSRSPKGWRRPLGQQAGFLSGRMPESPNECLVERGGASCPELALGARLTVSQDNEDYEDIGDIFKVTSTPWWHCRQPIPLFTRPGTEHGRDRSPRRDYLRGRKLLCPGRLHRHLPHCCRFLRMDYADRRI